MLKAYARPAIRLRGVRQNNLKNFDLDLPLNQLVVVTGVSGSGKSSLAFDTLYAEGQRRYVETFSPYARQFFDRMDKPRVDSIEGIPPAIAIEQRNAVRTTRSTVGTMTEICDFMKVVWPHLSKLHCRKCGRLVSEDSPRQIWEAITSAENTARSEEILVTFDLPLSDKLSFQESLALIANQGYQRILFEGKIVRLEELEKLHPAAAKASSITVIQDRLKPVATSRSRFVEACEQAYHFGKGKLAIHALGQDGLAQSQPARFSKGRHCAHCDLEYREPSPALFSFNNPLGACPACRGFGRIISIDYNLAMPDRTKTLAQGVVKPWQSGMSADCQRDLMKACRHFEIPTNVPFNKLPKKWQDFVIEGDKDYGKDEEHQWPRAWYGVKGFFRWLESRAYKMHVRVLLSRYRAYTPCPECHGQRFQPETLLYRLSADEIPPRRFAHDPSDPPHPFPLPLGGGEGAGRAGEKVSSDEAGSSITLADFYRLTIAEAAAFIELVGARHKTKASDPLGMALREVRSRLGYLEETGLGYLTLDRPTRSLSGGETERVNLTTCLGTRLVNTLFVLDEPSVGLHARDTERLIKILRGLQQAGNTVLVVEHEPSIMRAADQIVDLGPGQGESGGQVVYQGPGPEIVNAENSITGQYLSGNQRIELPIRRPITLPEMTEKVYSGRYPRTRMNSLALNDKMVGDQEEPCEALILSGANCHNLKDLAVHIPLGRLVCVTGVSGSGKTTLIREVLLPLLSAKVGSGPDSGNKRDLSPEGEAESPEDTGADAAPESNGGGSGATISGWESLSRVMLVDQSSLGRTPRSNPAVYVGAFNDIREFFARSPEAQKAGLSSGAFSFNSTLGQCQACRGAGFEKIEMQFLSDVFIRCQECDGRRYRPNVLEVKLSTPKLNGFGVSLARSRGWISGDGGLAKSSKNERIMSGERLQQYSIADLLDATVEEAIRFLQAFHESSSARRAAAKLDLLREVGLGYLRLGQPINTLSGGESQRLKLVRHLAGLVEKEPDHELQVSNERTAPSSPLTGESESSRRATIRALRAQMHAASSKTLFLFDEPTTGLHFEDVRLLLQVFQRLVNAGHSVLVIEHNLDVIKSADWVIDLGPEAGDGGGRVVVAGTPEDLVACSESHTGKALTGLIEPVASGPKRRHRPFKSTLKPA